MRAMHRRERQAVEDVVQRRLQLASSTTRRSRGSCSAGNVSSSRSSRSCQRARTAAISSRASSTFASISSCGGLRVVLVGPHVLERRADAKQRGELVGELQLVRDRQLDVDPLDAVGVVAEPLERDDDVLVDLERVGVLGDRRGARAVEPELLARFGRHRDEALRRRARSRCARPRTRPSPRLRRSRRRCRRAAPSAAGRGASPWSRSRPP